MATPENPKNPESPEPREELNRLERQVSGDRRKFETLIKNNDLKSGLNKIFKKEAESTISTFWSGYKENETNRHLSIESWTRLAIKSHPDLASFICGDLGLPYEELAVRGMKNTKFSQLTLEQKMGFISFQEALRYYNGDISRISSRDFIKQCQNLTAQHVKGMTDRFNAKLTSSQGVIQGIAGVVDLEKVLKKEYGFTEAECKKMREYIELIQSHPEYVGGVENLKVQEAGIGFWGGLGIGVLIGIAASIGGYFTYKYISGLFQTIPTEVRVYGDHTEIVNFKETFKVMSAITTTDSFEREFKENGFNHVHTGSDILKPAEWLINKGADLGNRTGIANRDLTLRIKCDNYHVFDFENMRCFVEKKDGIRVVRVTGVKKPETITNVTNVEVLESHREIIHRKKFDDFDFKAQEILKKEANETASSSEQIRKAEESLAKHILSVFKSTGCCNSDIAVEGKDIQGIIIEFEDNEHPRYVNIEGRRHTNN